MAKKFSKPELSRKINGDIPFDTTPDSEETPKIRLDIATLEQYPRYSRATIQKFIKNGQVTVNGDIIDKPNTMIDENAKIKTLQKRLRASARSLFYIPQNAERTSRKFLWSLFSKEMKEIYEQRNIQNKLDQHFTQRAYAKS